MPWFGFEALWPRSPSMALVFLAVVVIGVISLRWQAAAWISHMRAEHAPDGGKFYVDQPPVPWRMAAQKIGLLIAGGALVAYLLQGRLGLSFWQFFFIVAGFPILREFPVHACLLEGPAGAGVYLPASMLNDAIPAQFRNVRLRIAEFVQDLIGMFP